VNAVNGVINITTRHARDTEGDLTVLRADDDGAQAAFRHGQASVDGAWRIYGKAFGLNRSELASGQRVDDDWAQAQVGFRGDWTHGAERISVNANAYRGRQGQPAPGEISSPGASAYLDDINTRGANLTGRWEHALEGGASLAVQAYYDYRYRQAPPTFTDAVEIADLQFQHSLPRLGAHSLVWGAEYRTSWDHVTNSPYAAFLPADDKQAWASVFAQDEVALRDDLRLTAGARVERNPYTGADFLPSLRLSWRLNPAHALWAGLSRTVRAPARLDADVYIPGVPPYLLAGGPQVRSEVARVFEVGYRGQVGQDLSYSVTAFRNLYDHLRTQDTSIVDGRPTIVFDNLMEGRSHGIEAWGSYQMSDAWRLSAGLSALHEVLGLKAGSTNVASLAIAGFDPAYTAQLRSNYVFDERRELELAVRRVSALGVFQVPAYSALDARFGWRLAPGMELSVAGTNLNGSHAEYSLPSVRSEIGRTVGVKLTWQK
jgi:iron complex outermembrane receptor protein